MRPGLLWSNRSLHANFEYSCRNFAQRRFARTRPRYRPQRSMAIRLRLARHRLTRNAAQFNLVATESHARATAQPLELLGTYNPRPQVLAPVQRSPNGQRRSEKEWGPGQYPPRNADAEIGIKSVEWNLERVRHWLSQGALPTKSVEKLLVQAGVIG